MPLGRNFRGIMFNVSHILYDIIALQLAIPFGEVYTAHLKLLLRHRSSLEGFCTYSIISLSVNQSKHISIILDAANESAVQLKGSNLY